MDKKDMNTEEYLEYLTREEKRSALLAKFETDPTAKRAAKRENTRLKKLIKHVRKLAGCSIETAELKARMTLEE